MVANLSMHKLSGRRKALRFVSRQPNAAPMAVAAATSAPAAARKLRRFANEAPYVTTSSQISATCGRIRSDYLRGGLSQPTFWQILRGTGGLRLWCHAGPTVLQCDGFPE